MCAEEHREKSVVVVLRATPLEICLVLPLGLHPVHSIEKAKKFTINPFG